MRVEIIYMTEPKESESNPLFRTIRNKLGYGKAWTLKETLKEIFICNVLPYLLISVVIVLYIAALNG